MATLITWGNIHQFYPLETIPADLLTDQLRNAPKNDNERVLRRHRCRWVSHFLLWQLCKIANISTALLAQIYRTPSGRPQFPVEHIDFNISHSGDWVAVVLNVNENPAATRAQTAVGIDIESPRKVRDFNKLLQHFASPPEQDWFMQQTDEAAAFYRIWCMREAVLKSQGVGIIKLTEVCHNPELLTIHSAYCPPGQFIFIDELPFYLGVFAASDALPKGVYMKWNGLQPTPYPLKHVINYSVNL
ncbi:MAG TPA: 4'-phosphopantetheinyl transferase [Pasteurellaceae bacterium]|nr:4'-phosphopantetheinyl transferase [Pasteurellaceae bacterium]